MNIVTIIAPPSVAVTAFVISKDMAVSVFAGLAAMSIPAWSAIRASRIRRHQINRLEKVINDCCPDCGQKLLRQARGNGYMYAHSGKRSDEGRCPSIFFVTADENGDTNFTDWGQTDFTDWGQGERL